MATDETLSATIKIKDSASDDLQKIASSFQNVASEALDAAEGSLVAASAFDEAEDEADSLAESLRSVAGAGSAATAALYSASAAASTLNGGLGGAEDEAGDLNRTLMQMAGIAPFAAMGGAGAGFFGEGGDSILAQRAEATERLHDSLIALDRFETKLAMDIEPGGAMADLQDAGDDEGNLLAALNIPRINLEETLSGIRNRASGVDDEFDLIRMLNIGQGGRLDRVLALDPTTKIDPDEFDEIAESVQKVGKQIGDLSEISDEKIGLDVENAEQFQAFATGLKNLKQESRYVHQALSRIDAETADHLLRNANSAEELRRGLARTSSETEKTELRLEGLQGTSREVMDEMISAATSAEEFDEQIDDVGDKASKTGAELVGLNGVLKSHTINTAIAANSVDNLGDELQETGNEALTAMMKVGAAGTAMGSFQSMIGNTRTQLGPFTTTLSTVAQLLPTIISLVTVLGGMLTGGLAGGVGLAGILGGGLLAIGEQTADRMEATASATGEASDEMEALEEASSDAERAMIGLGTFMEDVRNAAFEALEPLRQPIFAEFTTRAIEHALTLLGEFAQVVAWGADPLMEMADVIADSFWNTYPAFMDELVRLMRIVGPMLQELAIGAIEAMPRILAAMADHAQMLGPNLMELGAAIVDLLPALLELGTLMLRGVLPNLIGFLRGVGRMTPAIILLARVLGNFIATLDPIIKWLFEWGGAIMVLNSVIPFLIMALAGLRMITKVLLIQPLAAMFWSIVKGALYAKWAVTALTGAVAALGSTLAIVTVIGAIILALAAIVTYFDLWDELIWGVITAWNALIRVVGTIVAVIANGLVQAVNVALWALGGLIDLYNKIAEESLFLDTMEVEFEYLDEYKYSEAGEGLKLDRSKSKQYASHIPGQDNSAPGPGSGMRYDSQGNLVPSTGMSAGSSDSQVYSGAGQRGRPGGDRPYSTVDTVNIYADGQTDERRIEEAVKRGVRQADQQKRTRSTHMN